MRRALELAEGALRGGRMMPRRSFAEQRQRLAKSIIERARCGQTDPVVLSAAALTALETPRQPELPAAFRSRGPIARRSTRRTSARSMA